jgi:hypothetical protein
VRYFAMIVTLIGTLLLAACVPATVVPPTSTPTLPPTVAAATTAAPTNTVAPTDTTVPPTDTAVPTATTAPSATTAPATATSAPPAASATTAATAGPVATVTPATYIDDRSDAAALMTSFASAINLHQYLRAYSYWRPGAAQLPPYPQFEAGYASTQSMQLTLGTITGDAGAGQRYFSVPTTLIAHVTGGVTQTFVGCYVLHMSVPSLFGAPPFQPLGIDQAQVQQVANNANTAGLMAQACQNYPGQPLQVTPAPDPNDISTDRYLDDRTDAVQVLRSLFNAVNRKEYVRAYWYWEPNAQGLAPFNQFQQGYATTAVVTLTVGTVASDAGAGQRYYTVPVVLVSTSTANVTQTFAACYILHLASPDIQGTPPYRPIGIRSAKAKLVANNADKTTLLAQACP